MKDKKFDRTLMNSHDIDRALNRMALQIMEDNRVEKKLALIGIYTGGVYLAERLQRIIVDQEELNVPVGSLDINLYRDDWSLISQNPIVKKTSIPFFVEDYTLILIDDVLYTGRTIRAALDAIMDLGRPRSIKLAVLVNRNCGRELPIRADYLGIDVLESASAHVNVLLQEKGGRDAVILESEAL